MSEVEPERCFYVEAVAILNGTSLMLPERRHLESLQEHHEFQLIRVMNLCDALNQAVGEMA